MNEFFDGGNSVYRCKECGRLKDRYPLEMDHSELCTTPIKIKIYQRDKLNELKNTKFELKCQIRELSKIRDKLLQNVGILDEGEEYIEDYIEAISSLS